MPPYPLFTFVGFLIHTVVFYAVGIRCSKRWNDKSFFLIGIGSLLNAINFNIILVLFFLFPNLLMKSYIFLFNASVIVPFGVLFFVGALVYYGKRSRAFLLPYLVIGGVLIGYLYLGTLEQFRNLPFESSYVHPSFPKLVGQNQSAGIISGLVMSLFFFYNAFLSTLFIKRRALIFSAACLLLGASSLYWISLTPTLYISAHIIGSIG